MDRRAHQLAPPDGWQALAVRHVVVVVVHPSAVTGDIEELLQSLDETERERVRRLRRVEDRRRSAVGLALTRALLGQWLELPPAAVPLERTATGKPIVAVRADGPGPWCNVSHSGDVVLVAFSRFGRVGVDVEEPHAMDDLLAVATAAFVADEVAQLRAVSPADQLACFYRLWTRKEAMAKALGLGLVGLDRIHCDGAAHAHNALRLLDVAGEHRGAWCVHTLTLPGTAVPAAIAYEGAAQGVQVIVG